jgi:hypothetical protein
MAHTVKFFLFSILNILSVPGKQLMGSVGVTILEKKNSELSYTN